MNTDPVIQLDNSYHHALKLAKKIPADLWHQQFHPDLSPIGWHIGHCVFIESYWLQDKLAENGLIGDDLKNLYMPWLSPKKERAKKLPETGELVKALTDQHTKNIDLLNNFIQKESSHKLLENNYLPLFLLQHYYQHIETLNQIIQCVLINTEQEDFKVITLEPRSPVLPEEIFSAASTLIGATEESFAYDNELSRHENFVDDFVIAKNAVSSAEYLGFMESGGYQNKKYWSDEGLNWLEKTKARCPLHWKKNKNKKYYCIEQGNAVNIHPDKAVHGINYFEAEAFAQYAGCRLPTEIEWEHAVTSSKGCHLNTGESWEWTKNYFYPYPDFSAHPYKNYSETWFDNQHYTLRGGSIYTDPELKRPTFRNFYTPEKKHIFAGLRLAIAK